MSIFVGLEVLTATCLGTWLGVCGAWVAQQPPQSPPAAQQTDASQPTPEQLEELADARTIITAAGNTRETRLITAVRLLRMTCDARIDVAVELLSAKTDPEAAIAMCRAIASVGTRQPELLDERLVDPLLALLGEGDDERSTVAASALAAFRNGGVAQRLGTLARDEQRPIAQRTSAIDALALNSDRRVAINELIQLTTVANPVIVRRVLDALRPASRVDFGDDLSAWQAWWQRKTALNEAQWLRDRLDLAVERNAALRAENLRLRRHADARAEQVAQRFGDLLRKIYQLTTQRAQRDGLLQQWLLDPMVEYRLCALSLVREQINDGIRPAAAIRDAVKQCLSARSAEVRKAGLEIIGVLTDPQDAVALLDLLPGENDPHVRATILRVLGRLGNAMAIDALIAELKTPTADLGCVREAARSLGDLFAQGQADAAAVEPAVGPLLDRFEHAPPDDLRLREELLGAMAKIGDRRFTPVFISNLSAQTVELLLPAITGIEVVEARDQLDRLLALLAHGDPRVRQLASQAVGALGSDAAHLEALITRVDPNAEANAGVRDAAWVGFRAVLDRQPPAVRLQWADRLNNLPDRQIMLLEELIAHWSANTKPPPELTAARAKLWPILIAQGDYAEAVPHLRQLRRDLPPDDPNARALGVELVRASLRSGRYDRAAEIITEVAAAPDAETKTAIRDALVDYMQTVIARGDAASLEPLITQLESLHPALPGPQWPARLQEFKEKVRSAIDGPSDNPHDP